MHVKLLTIIKGRPEGTRRPYAIIEVTDEEGERMIARGAAVLAKPDEESRELPEYQESWTMK
jgi:hypothetical protein